MISAGVLGSPIAHSLSPLLHRTAYEILGVEASYDAHEVKSGGLLDFLATTGSELNCLSLTMPLKEEALQVADHVSELSRQVASGNTLQKSAGEWHLTSTDVEGFTFALQSHDQSAKGDVLIIGSGATARAVAAACDLVSDSITVLHRNTQREASMIKAAPSQSILFCDWNVEVDLSSFALVVNTTPGDSASIFVGQINTTDAIFFEVLYNPWPTTLLSKFRQKGNLAIDGLDLLIHQAISQVQLFSGHIVDRGSMAQQLRLVGEKALS